LANIHPTAIIEDGAKVGKDVTIGPFCIVKKDVTIGDRTVLESHVVIDGKTTIGSDNHIFPHAVLGTIPQDLKFDGEETELIIGDKNRIREHTLINTGTAGGGYKTLIGSNNLIMGHVHIGHDCILGNNIVVANSCAIAGHVQINDHVVVGGLSALHQFVSIGKHAMIGGGSIVIQDIPHFCLAEGNRATLRALNINGLRRRFEDRKVVDALNKAYKALFKSGNALAEVANELLQSEYQEVQELAKFVQNTKRGIPFR
jgi:UDP-N-acetylglucosamine acyltransferase